MEQQRFMGAELARKRAGKKTKTGMEERTVTHGIQGASEETEAQDYSPTATSASCSTKGG